MSDNLTKTKQNQGKKMCERRLYNIAVYYLERYSASTHQLRQVLKRRVIKAKMKGQDIDGPAADQWIESVITKLTAQGFLNDQTFVETKVRSMKERGKSIRSIRMTLKQKGLSEDMVKDAINEDEDPSHDLAAAMRLVKKKKLGCLRPKSQQKESYQKDLATLARQGFSYDVAKQALAVKNTDDISDAIFS